MKDMLHWWVGRLLVFFSIITVFLGFAELSLQAILFIILSAWLIFCIVVFVILEIRKRKYQSVETH